MVNGSCGVLWLMGGWCIVVVNRMKGSFSCRMTSLSVRMLVQCDRGVLSGHSSNTVVFLK